MQHGTMRVGGVLRGGEAQVVIAQEAREKGVGRVYVRDAGQAQLLDQAIMDGLDVEGPEARVNWVSSPS